MVQHHSRTHLKILWIYCTTALQAGHRWFRHHKLVPLLTYPLCCLCRAQCVHVRHSNAVHTRQNLGLIVLLLRGGSAQWLIASVRRPRCCWRAVPWQLRWPFELPPMLSLGIPRSTATWRLSPRARWWWRIG